MTFVLHANQFLQATARGGRFLDARPSVFRLVLTPASLLYPYSAGRVDWGDKDELSLGPGVYAAGGRYLVVEAQRGGFVTEAAAFEHLGAGAALSRLGLGDAAISLGLGDLTNARYQWLRHRDGL